MPLFGTIILHNRSGIHFTALPKLCVVLLLTMAFWDDAIDVENDEDLARVLEQSKRDEEERRVSSCPCVHVPVYVCARACVRRACGVACGV